MNINGAYLMDHDVIQILEHSFPEFANAKKITYRIRFNDTFVTTRSGKNSWNTMGAAKNAFNNHLFGSSGRTLKLLIKKTRNNPADDYEYVLSKEEVSSLVKELIALKVLEFVKE